MTQFPSWILTLVWVSVGGKFLFQHVPMMSSPQPKRSPGKGPHICLCSPLLLLGERRNCLVADRAMGQEATSSLGCGENWDPSAELDKSPLNVSKNI